MSETTQEQRSMMLELIPEHCAYDREPALVLPTQVPIIRAALRDADRLARLEADIEALARCFDDDARLLKKNGWGEDAADRKEDAKRLRALLDKPEG